MVDGQACEFCGKVFRKESTLLLHNCEDKKRIVQKNDPGVILGMHIYLRFYEITQGSAKLKTYDDFRKSPYYNAFVKFGKHIKKINAIGSSAFIDWVIKKNKKLDQWCRDEYYEAFLHDYIRHETANAALERFIKLSVEWGDENGSDFNHIFNYGNENKLCYYITQGKISPWMIYNCKSGIEFLERLNDEHVKIIFTWIDPEYWQKRFVDYIADTELIKNALLTAGY